MSEEKLLIEKKILHAGTKSISFRVGTKVKFHFQTRKCNSERTLIDDSKKMGAGNALELVLGKKFKLEVWEAIIQKMSLNEVAEFTVHKTLVSQYPFVSKTLRDLNKKEKRGHTCAMTIQTEGLGYDDLNDLLKNPCDLQFIIDLIEVSQPEDYEKETWQLTETEKITLIPQLKAKGNLEFQNKNYKLALKHYTQALGILEQLMLKEKPKDTDWNALNEKRVPILLNYAQCKLFEGDYYSVIEHCTTVLQTDPDNTKALYRRAKAHVGAWNPDLAKEDFHRVMELDQSLTSAIKKELLNLESMIQKKNSEDKDKMKNLFTKRK